MAVSYGVVRSRVNDCLLCKADALDQWRGSVQNRQTIANSAGWYYHSPRIRHVTGSSRASLMVFIANPQRKTVRNRISSLRYQERSFRLKKQGDPSGKQSWPTSPNLNMTSSSATRMSII